MTTQSLAQRTLRICVAEARLSFGNSAVFGGFAKHLRGLWAKRDEDSPEWVFDTVDEVLTGYEELSRSKREARVAELQASMQALLDGKGAPVEFLDYEHEKHSSQKEQHSSHNAAPSSLKEQHSSHNAATSSLKKIKTKTKPKIKPKIKIEKASGTKPSPKPSPPKIKKEQIRPESHLSSEKTDDFLDVSIRYCKGVGPKRAAHLERLEIFTRRDLVFHFPHRYEDRRRITPIAQLVSGRNLSIRAKIEKISMVGRGRHSRIIANVADETGSCSIIWFNQAYLLKVFPRGASIIFYGRIGTHFGRMQMQNPEWEVLKDGEEIGESCCITPVYPLTEGLHRKQMHRMFTEILPLALPRLMETLPDDILKRFRLMGLQQAMRAIHSPNEVEDIKQARRRLVFEEFFLLQVALAIKRHFYSDELPGVSCSDAQGLVKRFLKSLPFSFTGAQARALEDILKDVEASNSMSRLLQGEVGSGKTVVALAAMLACVGDGYQATMMAPTEILAEQHYLNLKRMCEPLGLRVDILVGGQRKKQRRLLLDRVLSGLTDIVVGTHALIQESVEFHRLGLIVIDEQHRFGVTQRAKLRRKGMNPNLLVMTATPIPRTLCLTLYGDLDLTIIDEMPPGRIPVKTEWFTWEQEEHVWNHVANEVKAGRQVFVVCPLIEESESMQAEAAVDTFNRLRTGPVKDAEVELLHGRMSNDEKDLIMNRLRSGEIDVLVATTVIEVGVDVPNASILVVLNAERFGLAQLHQLRGRIGRGQWASTCYLVGEAVTEEARKRLETMVATNDGFQVAEEDLKLRGPGEFFGTRQSGIPGFKIADLARDLPVLEAARREAAALIARDPYLVGPGCQHLRQVTSIKFRDFLAFRH